MSPKVITEYSSQGWTPSTRLTKTLHTKAYLVFLDQPWRRFVLGMLIAKQQMRMHFYDRSGCSISPPFDVHSDPAAFVAVLAAVMFGSRPCIGFDPTMTVKPVYPLHVSRYKVVYESIRADVPDCIPEESEDGHDLVAQPEPSTLTPRLQPVTLPAHVEGLRKVGPPHFLLPAVVNTNGTPIGPVPEQASVPDTPVGPIGVIKVHKVVYEIIEILFSSAGFLGRGTVIYLARHDGQMYIIKDHWVENPSHEAEMMKAVNGIPSVPTLIDHWEVELLSNIPDVTSRYRAEKYKASMKGNRAHVQIVMSPCGWPLTKFRTKRELVTCIRDVLVGKHGLIQKPPSLM